MVLLISVSGQSQTFASRKVTEKFWISCPKNLSVLHILVILSSSEKNETERFPHPLAGKARESFKTFRDHPAVQMTGHIFQNMWYFPLNYAACFYFGFPDAQFREDIIPPREYKEDKTIQALISTYIEKVNAFYRDADFERFWGSCEEDIRKMIDVFIARMATERIPEYLEKLYQQEAETYTLVLCPFMQSSATHVEVQKKSLERHYYALLGGKTADGSLWPVYFAFHEFSHSFIEPVSAKFSGRIQSVKELYKPLEKQFSRMGYRDWDRAFNEHIVTAGQLHLTRMAFGDSTFHEMVAREKRKGFQLIDRFYSHIKRFADHQEQYPSLDVYYPVLLEDLACVRIDSMRIPDVMGFFPGWTSGVLLVKGTVPGSAFDRAGVQAGDILIAIEEMRIRSEEEFNEAKNLYWSGAEEGDSVRIKFERNDQSILKKIVVPFKMEYFYAGE
jgi:hypothetical protein